MRHREDLLLLLLAGASLLLGGGFGCEPDLQGADFRAASVLSDPSNRLSPRESFLAFGGRRPPGDATLELPYPMVAPFGVSARMGVFAESALSASVGAGGCIGFRDSGSTDAIRLCVSYLLGPARIHVSSSLDGATADCPDATRVELKLADDGVNATARYRCRPVDTFSTLASAPSGWSATEKWHPFVTASDLQKGGQVGFDGFLVDTAGKFSDDPEADIAFAVFTAFRLGLVAIADLAPPNPNPNGAVNQAEIAQGNLEFAVENVDPGFAASSGAGKLLAKARSAHAKLVAALELGGFDKYTKGFAKAAAAEAAALEALETGF